MEICLDDTPEKEEIQDLEFKEPKTADDDVDDIIMDRVRDVRRVLEAVHYYAFFNPGEPLKEPLPTSMVQTCIATLAKAEADFKELVIDLDELEFDSIRRKREEYEKTLAS